jgi:hypothetical protein
MPDQLYSTDYVAWAEQTAQKLRDCRFDEIDISALAEEIEDLGGSQRDSVDSRLTQLLMHLLKWQYQEEYRVRYGDKSWRTSIANQRIGLRKLFRKSPSLKRFAAECLPDSYADAVELAMEETGLKEFPEECPWTLDQALDRDFYPHTA